MTITVNIENSHERLLEGLDVWLRLRLISDAEVKRLCRQHLHCTIPALPGAGQPVTAPTALTRSTRLSHEPLLRATVGRTAQVLQRKKGGVALPPALFSKTSLMAEFSLMWLLFLGVFMVVVSSGVLAVSQWRTVPPEGQYLILLGYTLAFWVASSWTGQRENLRLTARMLKITTLLIIPVNFWMIDGLKLVRSGVGWAEAVFAALVLTAIIIRLLKVSSTLR